jgi:hypothetical protein
VYAIDAWHDGWPVDAIARSDAACIQQGYRALKDAALFREASLAAQIEFVEQVLREAE